MNRDRAAGAACVPATTRQHGRGMGDLPTSPLSQNTRCREPDARRCVKGGTPRWRRVCRPIRRDGLYGRVDRRAGSEPALVVNPMVCDVLIAVADQHMGSTTLPHGAADPNLQEVIRPSARNVHLDAETVEAANCRNG
jgi:hypothetical protein